MTSRGRFRGASEAAALAVTFLCSTNARAWLCKRVEDAEHQETGPSTSWFTRDLTYTFFAAGSSQLDGDTEFDILRASFLPWSAAQECAPPNRTTDLTFSESPERSQRDRVGYD